MSRVRNEKEIKRNSQLLMQTKDELNVEQVKWFVKKVTMESLADWVKKNPSQAKIVYQRIIAAAKGRLAANRAKNAKKKQEGGIFNGMSSLSKITLATNDDPKNRRMFIVEGDSAGGGAVDARCPETDSIAKLRGKPLNTHDLNETKIDANKEFSDITFALGCGIDKHFDMSKLTHNQIIAMADADVDGAHITSLLAVFFFKHMRPIIENGMFYIATAPLYEVKENGNLLFFKNKFEYNNYITDRILKKYIVGKVIKKDDKTILKKFTNEQVSDFIYKTERYVINLKNLSSKSVDKDIIEFIANNIKKKDLVDRLNKEYKEVTFKKLKNGTINVSGMYNNNYQSYDLDEEFFNDIKEISDFISDNKYNNLYYKIGDGKAKKVFISELRNEILKYGTPKYRKRFKGLGEMDYDELWYTTMRPNSGGITRVKANSMEELEKVFEVHFGNDPDKRKVFLKNFQISPDDIDN